MINIFSEQGEIQSPIGIEINFGNVKRHRGENIPMWSKVKVIQWKGNQFVDSDVYN